MKLVDGKFYLNGRGDLLGPMDERTPGVFLDQYGRLYRPDGRQWDHIVGSTGNIVRLADDATDPRLQQQDQHDG